MMNIRYRLVAQHGPLALQNADARPGKLSGNGIFPERRRCFSVPARLDKSAAFLPPPESFCSDSPLVEQGRAIHAVEGRGRWEAVPPTSLRLAAPLFGWFCGSCSASSRKSCTDRMLSASSPTMGP